MSYIMSGDLTAATLTVPRLSAVFPHEYEIVLTSNDGQMQYQLRTTIAQEVEHTLDDIDSAEWLAIPTNKWQYYRNKPLQVTC